MLAEDFFDRRFTQRPSAPAISSPGILGNKKSDAVNGERLKHCQDPANVRRLKGFHEQGTQENFGCQTVWEVADLRPGSRGSGTETVYFLETLPYTSHERPS